MTATTAPRSATPMTRDDARIAEMRHLTRRAATIYAAMGEEPSCDDWNADCVSDIDTRARGRAGLGGCLLSRGVCRHLCRRRLCRPPGGGMAVSAPVDDLPARLRNHADRLMIIARGDIPPEAADAAEAAAKILSLRAERDKWRRLETEAAQYVETVICLRTGFTGEPPHVGWKGLGLALTEALDERDALRADVTRLTASLAAAEAEAGRLRRAMAVAGLNAEALAEIKATVDGQSDQPVKDIVYGLIAEIAALSAPAS